MVGRTGGVMRVLMSAKDTNRIAECRGSEDESERQYSVLWREESDV
jgi:hypothetical protein